MDKQITAADVLEFLRLSGFKTAQQALENEITQSRQNNDSKVDEFLAKNASCTANEADFNHVYERLLAFISASPDDEKVELSAVLYPVFVIIYVGQIEKRTYAEAKAFFERFRYIQEDCYQDLMQSLATINSYDCLRNNVSVLQFAGETYVITLVRQAYNRLMQFIQQPNMHLLRIILTSIVHMKEIDGPSRMKALRKAGQGYIFGDVGFEANRKSILYGIIHFVDVDKAVLSTIHEAENATAFGNKKKRFKREPGPSSPGKAAAIGGTLSAKESASIPPHDRVPLPPLREMDRRFLVSKATEIASQECLRLIVDRNNALNLPINNMDTRKPSLNAVMFTVQSSGPRCREVTCMTFSEDCSIVCFALAPRNSIIVHSTKASCVASSGPNASGTGQSGSAPTMETGLLQLKNPEELERLNIDDINVLSSAYKDCGEVYRALIGHSARIYDLCLAPNKETLLSASADGTVRYWSLLSWSCLYCYDCSAMVIGGSSPLSNPVYSVSFSTLTPTGHYFVAGMGGDSCTALLYSLESFDPLRYFSKHHSSVSSVAFHPNANYVATGCWDRAVRLFDVLDGSRVRIFTGHKSIVSVLQFHPQGVYLVSGCSKGLICIWDIALGCMVAQQQHPPDSSLSVKDESDATGGGGGVGGGGKDGGTLSKRQQKRLKNMQEAQEKLNSRQDRCVSALAFCRHGHVLCSGDLAGNVCWWNFSAITAKFQERMTSSSPMADFQKEGSNRSMESICPPILLNESNEFLLSRQRTRNTSIAALQFSRKNILYAAGDFRMPTD